MAEEETPTQEVVLVQLPAWKAILLRCLFPITVLIFITASVGLYVLTDPQKETAIGKSYFADQWRRLIEWNPFCNAMLFNGSLLGGMYCIIQLRKHNAARLEQAELPADTRSRQQKRTQAREQKKLQ